MKTFINVAQMKLASLKEGQFVETGGYYTKGDAGQAKYLIVAAQAADGYGDHTLANGTVAVLQSNGDSSNSAVQFGALAGITNDSYLQLTALLNSVNKATFGKEDFYISQTVIFDNSNLVIDGFGYTSSNIIALAGFSGTHLFESKSFGLKMNNIRLVGDGGTFGAAATLKGLKLQRTDLTGNTDSFITDCNFSKLLSGVDVYGRNTTITGCQFETSLGGIEQFVSPEGETRGLTVRNNRFHSMGNIGVVASCIKMNSVAFGNLITGNIGDGSVYNFYNGPTQGSEITNNIINTLVNDGIISQGSTFLGLPLAGVISDNVLSKGAASYTGVCIQGQFNNTTINNNTCVGSTEHGIYASSGGGNKITNNLILSHDFNNTGTFDGIKCDGTNNRVESNHVRSAGKLTVNSAINMSGGAGILGDNFIDSTYSTFYGGKTPDFNLTSVGVGFGTIPDTDLHLAGYESKITSPDAVKANPVRRTSEHTGPSGVFAGAELRSVAVSSSVGNEAVDCRMTVNNRTVIEDRLVAFFNGGLGLQSPDGTWYKLQPPNGGGTISWVSAPYTP